MSDWNSEEEELKLPLNQFYPYIRCGLCCGFLIDATTITECLHTFCKSCIVKHFYFGNKCPTCTIVVHQTQPQYNIRSDRQLQDIVYKMVPNLEKLEQKRINDFYQMRGMAVPKPEKFPSPAPPPQKRPRKTKPSPIFTIPRELDVSLLLEFAGAEQGVTFKPLERPYVRVSGKATIRHVQLFISRKMKLSPSCQVDLVCGGKLLQSSQFLKDIQSSAGESALRDGMLVLTFGLIFPFQL